MEEANTGNLNVDQLLLAIMCLKIEIIQVEEFLKERKMIPYGVEDISVGGRTMGDLQRQHLAMQHQLTDILLDHKMEPCAGSNDEDLIAKVAASLLNSPDILEDRLRKEFEKQIGESVKRYSELTIFFSQNKPSPLVLSRLREALQCYVHGFFQGCAILCRSTVETALRERIKHLNSQEKSRITLGPLLGAALKNGIISKADYDLAETVKKCGDESVHDYKKCSPSEAFESLNNTKILLNSWYQ